MSQETTASSGDQVAEANLARLAMRDLETTMNRLIEVDGRALSLAARAGQLFLDGKVPEHRQAELVTAMEQVVNTSLEARKVIKDVSRMVSLTKAGSGGGTAAAVADGGPAAGGDAAESLGEQQRRATQRQQRLAKMRL